MTTTVGAAQGGGRGAATPGSHRPRVRGRGAEAQQAVDLATPAARGAL